MRLYESAFFRKKALLPEEEFNALFEKRICQAAKAKGDYLHFGWVDHIERYHKLVKKTPYSVDGIIAFLKDKILPFRNCVSTKNELINIHCKHQANIIQSNVHTGFDEVRDLVSKLKYGNTNTFFVRGTSGGLLIDTDYAGTLPLLYKEMKKNYIKLSDITYILATHYHPDHIGLVSELMELGVKLLLIDTQVEYVHFSDEIFSRDSRLKYKPIDDRKAVMIACRESREFLFDIGICGEIISTPSHSEDSISLILDNGSCIVGDLEPLSYLAAYANNLKLENDWKNILNYEPKKILYAHVNEKIMN